MSDVTQKIDESKVQPPGEVDTSGPIKRHTTFSGFDESENWVTVVLAPGDEMPDWAPDSVKNNELLWRPLPEDEPYVTDEETGTEVKISGEQRMDSTSPSFAVGYEGGSAEAVEAFKAGDHDLSPPPEEGSAEASYENMNKVQLSALAEERGLAHSGTRQDLIERLEQSDAENG